jgi:PAS domain S-box-containing protein
MPKKPKTLPAAADLRLRAEQRFDTRAPAAVVQPDLDSQRLLHELEVHQIELEMQNAELRLARDEAEAVLEKYTDLYEFAPVGYFTLDCKGIIQLVNLTGAMMIGSNRSRLVGRPFRLLVSSWLRPVFDSFLQQVFMEPTKRSMDFEIQNTGHPTKPVNIEVQRSTAGNAASCWWTSPTANTRKTCCAATRPCSPPSSRKRPWASMWSTRGSTCTRPIRRR